MNNLLKTTLIASILSSALATAEEEKTIRLVVSKKDNIEVMSASTSAKLPESNKQECALTPDGKGEWCLLPQSSLSSFGVVSQEQRAVRTSFETVTLNKLGYETQTILSALSEHYKGYNIDVDVAVKESGVPTDPELDAQSDYYGSIDASPMGMNVYSTWEKFGGFSGSEEPLSLVIMDSSFFANPEVDYVQGASFVTIEDQNGIAQVPSDNYAPLPGSADSGLCSGHGLGVAAAAAAKGNNGVGGSGLTNNVNVHPYRVMDCGVGFLSDTARAINHLTGDTAEGVTPFTGKPGVINLSLGATLDSTTSNGTYCPNFMQDAIDKAIDAGWSVVTAAGNYGNGEGKFTPANCEGVIAVGSYTTNGTRAEFSNYGPHIDFVTEGQWVLAPCKENDGSGCYWEGTSFSSPIVAGIVSYLREQTGMTDEEVKEILAFTANREQLDEDCEIDSCGNGVPDMLRAMTLATLISSDANSKMEYALNGKTECEQEWVTTHFGAQAKLCESVNVTLFDGQSSEGLSFQLLGKKKEQSWADATAIDTFTSTTFTLLDSELNDDEYGLRICNSEECLEKTYLINTDGISEKPIACQ